MPIEININITAKDLIAMNAKMDRLIADVANIRNVTDSTLTLITGIRQQLVDAGTDQAKLDELADSLEADATRLSGAAVANTPADPAVAPPATPDVAPVTPAFPDGTGAVPAP